MVAASIFHKYLLHIFSAPWPQRNVSSVTGSSKCYFEKETGQFSRFVLYMI